jgi:hypothetical protein
VSIQILFVSLDKPDADREDEASFAGRLHRVADLLRKGPAFDFLGVSGAFTKAGGLFPLAEEKPIACEAGGGRVTAVECLARHLGPSAELTHHQSSDVGIVSRARSAEVVGGWAYKNIGPLLPGVLRRTAVSGRLKLAEGGHVLPLYVVHISAQASNIAVRQAQVMGLISMVKESWQAGDLVPLVLGDFGFDRESSGSLWDMMRTDFDEITVAHGAGGTEHAWIGKESSFRGAGGVASIGALKRLPHLNDGGASLTSHSGIHLTADVRAWRLKRTFTASPRARSRGAPGLVATDRALHMAWSARQHSGQVTLARTTNGTAWDGPHGIEGHTNVGPSLAASSGRLYCAWTEPDKRVCVAVSTNDGDSFGSPFVVLDVKSADGPTLFAMGDRLELFFADAGTGKLAVTESADGADWSAPKALPMTSDHTPAVAAYGDKVYLAWTEKDETSSVSIVASPDGASWDAPKTSFATHPRRHSAKGPALLASAGRLTLAWIGPREPNGYAWFSGFYANLLDDYYRDYFSHFVQWTTSPDGHTWSVERTLDERSDHAPALAALGGRVYLAWTGVDADNLVNVKLSEGESI